MNEIIFFGQVLIIFAFASLALKLGRSALTAWIALQAILANFFVLKQIKLFGFDVTASDSFLVGGLLGLNFLQENFGKDEAKQAIKVCFIVMLFFTLISQLHLLYTPNAYDETQSAYSLLLSPSPRLFLASIAVFFIVQQLDMRLFALLKNYCPQLNFSVRTLITLIISQALDTVLFSFAGLYGLAASMFDIIVISFAVKLIVISCFTPLTRWSQA